MSRRKTKSEDYLPKKNEYCLSYKRIASLFLWHFILIGYITLYLFYDSIKYSHPTTVEVIVGIYLFLLLLSLPAISMCINYLRKSKINRIIFDHKEKVLIIYTEEGEKRIKFDAVRSTIEHSSNLRKGGIFTDNFTYTELCIYNGEKIIITSLLIDQNELFHHIPTKVKYEKAAFPFI